MKRTTFLIIFFLIVSILFFTNCSKKEVERQLPQQEKEEEPAATEEPETTPARETVSEESGETIQPEKTSIEEEQKIQTETTLKGEKVFELQLVAVRDYTRIEAEQNKLARYGYNTFITTIVKDGELVLFVPSQGNMKKITDSQVRTDMELYNWENKVLYKYNEGVWQMSLK